MPVKPAKKPEWADGASAIIEPSDAKKALGWVVEKPPHQFFNWLFNLIWQWIVYFELITDATQAEADTNQSRVLAGFDAIVGAESYATDATIAAAITRLSAGARILVLDSFALAAPIAMSKANMELVLKPGVIISAGVATTGFTISAAGCMIRGGKISGFSSFGIDVGSGGLRFAARDIWFSGNGTDVNDPNDLATELGCVN